MPRSSEQFDKIREEKKKLIMDTALELFAENGYHATTMRKIAIKASISKGLAYNYFKSKEEILHELILKGFENMMASVDQNRDGVISEDEFISFIRKNFEKIRENLEYWKLYYSLILQSQLTGSLQDKYMEMAKPVISMLHQFIESKGSKDPEADMFVLTSLIEGSFLLAISAPDTFPAEKMEKTVIDASLRFINSHP